MKKVSIGNMKYEESVIDMRKQTQSQFQSLLAWSTLPDKIWAKLCEFDTLNLWTKFFQLTCGKPYLLK